VLYGLKINDLYSRSQQWSEIAILHHGQPEVMTMRYIEYTMIGVMYWSRLYIDKSHCFIINGIITTKRIV